MDSGGDAGDTRTLGYKLTLALAATRLGAVRPPKNHKENRCNATGGGGVAVLRPASPETTVLPFTHSSINSKLRRQHFQMQLKNPGTREEEGAAFSLQTSQRFPAYKGGGRGSGQAVLESPISAAPDFFLLLYKTRQLQQNFLSCPSSVQGNSTRQAKLNNKASQRGGAGRGGGKGLRAQAGAQMWVSGTVPLTAVPAPW